MVGSQITRRTALAGLGAAVFSGLEWLSVLPAQASGSGFVWHQNKWHVGKWGVR